MPRNEVSIQETPLLLERVLAHLPLILWSVDNAGILTRFTGHGMEAVGVTPEEMLGRSVRELVPELPDEIRHVEAVLAGDTVGASITEWRGRVFEVRYFRDYADDGHVTGVSGISLDITDRYRSEARLRATERRLARIVANAPVILWAADRNRIVTLSEGGGLVHVGQAAGAAVGLTVERAVVPPDPDALNRIERAYSGEHVRHVREIEGRVFESQYLPERDDDGNVVGVSGLALDITQRREAEHRLRTTEAQLRQIINSVPVILTALDARGTITTSEGEGLAALGLKPGELVGASIHERCADEQSLGRFMRALAGETVHVVRQSGELVHDIHYFPQRDERGEVQGVTALALDVTERTRTAAALDASERHLHHLVSSMPVVLWALDRNGIITHSEGSGLAALGLASGDTVGENFRRLYADIPGVVANLERAFAGETFSARIVVRGIVFDVHYFPDRDARGEVTGVSGVAVDVTASHHTEQELQLSEGRFRSFASNVDVGLWIAAVDTRRIVYANPVFWQIYGWEASDPGPSFEDWLGMIHVDDRERVRQSLSGWHPERPSELVYRIRRADGSVCWIRGRRFPVHTPSGQLALVGGFVEDVTEARRTEADVRRIKERLAGAQRIAHVGSWDWDLATGEFWGSDELYGILGLPTPGEASSFEAFAATIHPEDRATTLDILNPSAAEASFEAIHRIHRSDGAIRTVRNRGERSFDSQGRPVRILGTLQDVTENLETEKTLAVLSSAVDQTADLVVITDRDGRLEHVNPAFEAHTGFSRDEALGATPRLLKSHLTPTHVFDELWETVLAGRVFRGVLANRKRSGEIFYEEKTITPIRGPDGGISHFVSVGRDITASKNAEAVQQRLQDVLRKSASEWKATFDAVESPLVLVDAAGIVKRLNRAARDLWGRPYDEILGASLSSRGEEPWGTMLRAVAQVQKERSSVSASAESAAEARTWDVIASPVQDPEGEQSVIVLARDVTPIVELQRSLRRSEKMSAMGALVAGVAHEVRNPLFGISAALDAFEADFGDREDFREYAVRLRHEVSRVASLMHDLLEYGRPSPSQFVRGQIEEILGRALRVSAGLARARQVSLVSEVPSPLPSVLLEPERLTQVFRNLVENAIQHSPVGGTVTARARCVESPEASQVEVEVQDEGPGFRTEDMPSVFEPFFTRRRGGTGLGLSIVQKIVDEHRGSVRVSNRPEGGACVTVVIPVSEG